VQDDAQQIDVRRGKKRSTGNVLKSLNKPIALRAVRRGSLMMEASIQSNEKHCRY